MDEQNRELLNKYIGRLLELQESRKWQLSEDELRQIALEIGLTEADLAEVKEAVESRLQRGATYASTGDWPAAAREYEAAVELDPVNGQTQLQLTEFYFQQWRKTQKGKDALDAAIEKCLQFDPDFPAVKDLLHKVRRLNRRRRIWRWLKGLFLIFITPILLAIGYRLFEEIGFITPSPSGLEGQIYAVPVEIVPLEAGEGITLVFDQADITHDESVYDQRSFRFDYAGRISSERYEVQQLRYTIDFLDAEAEVVASTYLWLFNADSGYSGDGDTFTLHPGDWLLFAGEDDTYFADADPSRIALVRVHGTRFERVRPPAQYPDYPLQPLEWRSQQVDYLDFELRQRESTYYNDEYARPRHYLQFEITHRGTAPCRELVLGIEWLAPDGAVVRSREETVISLDNEPVAPGTRLIIHRTAYFDEEDFPSGTQPFASYRVFVKTAD